MSKLGRMLVAGWLLGSLSCTATRVGSLGADLPLDEDSDAGLVEEDPTFPDATQEEDAEAPEPDAQPASAMPNPARDAQVTRDAKVQTDSPDAAATTCTPGGHRPFEGVPQPGDRDWDGGRPPLFDDPPPPPMLPPIGYEAGVPPFCCTLMTPWFCMPLTPSGP